MLIDKEEVDHVVLKDYSIDESTGRLDVRDEVKLQKAGDAWKLDRTPPGREVDTYKINSLVQAIDQLSIEGVRPKPQGLTASLSRGGGVAISQSDMLSLQEHGFYFARDGRLVSNEGELQARAADGVTYTLRFGEVAVGHDAGAATDAKAAGASSENRYLMITASFDPGLFPEPPAATDRSFESKPDSALTIEERRQKDVESYHKIWEQRIQMATKRAADLNERFSGWYYVISGESFSKLHLKREDILRDKPTQS
jgi:hypothetical protein